MILLTDAEKVFDKIQHQFMIKTLNKVGLEGKYLDTIKASYEKPTANINVNDEKQKACDQGHITHPKRLLLGFQ